MTWRAMSRLELHGILRRGEQCLLGPTTDWSSACDAACDGCDARSDDETPDAMVSTDSRAPTEASDARGPVSALDFTAATPC
jgi:hypothetical protein